MAVYYVSTSGSNNQPGTLDQPFASLQHAHNLAQPGDIIYVRGGVYNLSSPIVLTNDGMAGQPITVMNFPGEKPVFDLAGMTYSNWNGYVLDLASASWNHIKGLELRNGPDGGLRIRDASHYNVIEALDVHHNGRYSEWEGRGIWLYGAASHNLLLNNDSHDNQDLRRDNADGFVVSTTGMGNVLRGNRAWGNSDDGFDFFNGLDGTNSAPVLIEGNWAFNNGFDANGNPAGDGTGFKLGGIRAGTGGTSGGHTVINNMAWGNRAIGFDENGWNGGSVPSKLYNNTAYNNGTYNFGFWGHADTLRNNLAFGTGAVSASTDSQYNSWNLGLTLTAGDFLSLDDSTARSPRGPDGALPATKFLHLAAGSSLIDRGIDVGYQYAGAGPDLGGVESIQGTVGTSSVVDQVLYGDRKADTLTGAAGDDQISGLRGNDILSGLAGNDRLDGGDGDDQLDGGDGDDILAGGSGADRLTGGAGNDLFVLEDVNSSLPRSSDDISGFAPGVDLIDLHLIDANSKLSGDQAFTFIGADTFTGRPGELRFAAGILSGDVDGDSVSDFAVAVHGIAVLQSTNFVL